jgi:hypothetical protein
VSKARVSAAQVKEILDTQIEDSVLLANMIDSANLYIDTNLPTSITGHSEETLAKIELYLAAHITLMSTSSGGAGGGALKYTKLGDASEAYNTDHLGAGLNASRFGELAIMFDTSGILAGLSTAKLTAQFRVV